MQIDFFLIFILLPIVIFIYLSTIYNRMKLLKEVLNMDYARAKSLVGQPDLTYNCMLSMINIYKYSLPAKIELYQDDILITVLGNSLILDYKNIKYCENYRSNDLLVSTEEYNTLVFKFILFHIPKELKARLKKLS